MNPKIIDYCIIPDREDFALIIKKLINEGWQPLGGVAIAYDPDKKEMCLHQAMVKYYND